MTSELVKEKEEATMISVRKIAKQYFKRSFSLPAANYKLASYHHDQCERSIRMHLFSLEKRDLTLVLTLFAAFGLLCIILASIAPQAHVFDTILISKSMMDSQDQNSSSIDKQVERESIDMDLAPISNVNDQAQKEISTEQTRDKKKILEDKVRAGDEYETFVLTKPLNNLNKHIGLDLRVKFNGISTLNGFSNSDKILVSFKIDFIFETAADVGSKLLKIARKQSNAKSLFLAKGSDKGNATISGYKQQTVAHSKTMPTNSGFRNSQQLNVTFDCEIIEQSRPNSRGEISFIKRPSNKQLLKACVIPDLSVQFKLSHSKKCIYKITFKISDIKFKSSSNLTEVGDEGHGFKLKSSELAMLLSYTNSSFVLLTIFIRLILLILSFSIACCFVICLSEYKFKLWSLEQKWTALLLILLVGSNRPLYILEFTASNQTPSANSEIRSSNYGQNSKLNFSRTGNPFELVDSILDLTFICGLLASWSCFAHSIRRMSRPFLSFYATKLSIIGLIWIFIAYANLLANLSQQQVTFGNFKTTLGNQSDKDFIRVQLIDIAFYAVLIIYFANLAYHYVKSYIELKLMSYFTIRFRVQTVLCVWMLISYSLIIFVIPSIHSPRIAHNFLQQTSVILQEMNYDKPVNSIVPTEINNISRLEAKTHKEVYEYDGDNDNVKEDMKLNSDDKSIIEMISLVGFGNQENKTRITSTFKTHSFLKHYQQNSNDRQTNNQASLPSKPRLLAWLPANHLFDSACSFLCYIIVNNLYVLTCAYFYWPVVRYNPHIACKYLPTSQSEARRSDEEIDSTQ